MGIEVLIVIGVVLFLASGLSSQQGAIFPASSVANQPPFGLQPNASLTAPVITTGTISGVSSGTSALAGGIAAGSLAGAITGGVAVVGAIGAALLQAHQQRVQQATNENTAVNNGVRGYDAGVRQVNAAFNSRQLDPATTINLLQQIMAYFWAEVVPVIQPGRNGCQGGAQCSGLVCGGDVGAACCVGCGDLAGTPDPIPFAGEVQGSVYWGILGSIAVIQNGGGPVWYPTVFGSKYGGTDRPGYWLTWAQASAA